MSNHELLIENFILGRATKAELEILDQNLAKEAGYPDKIKETEKLINLIQKQGENDLRKKLITIHQDLENDGLLDSEEEIDEELLSISGLKDMYEDAHAELVLRSGTDVSNGTEQIAFRNMNSETPIEDYLIFEFEKAPEVSINFQIQDYTKDVVFEKTFEADTLAFRISYNEFKSQHSGIFRFKASPQDWKKSNRYAPVSGLLYRETE